jgi:hypothetical protein
MRLGNEYECGVVRCFGGGVSVYLKLLYLHPTTEPGKKEETPHKIDSSFADSNMKPSNYIPRATRNFQICPKPHVILHNNFGRSQC